jgi:hypothetical protein
MGNIGCEGKENTEIGQCMMGVEALAMRVEDVRYLGEESLGVEGLEVFLNGCVWLLARKRGIWSEDVLHEKAFAQY